jgi:membrane-bound acyltransferase YfiQ involved in biofilm formation
MCFAFLAFYFLYAWCLALFQHSTSQRLVLLALCFSLLSALLSWSLALLGTSCFYIFLFGSTWFWMQQTQLEKTKNLIDK